MGYPTSERLKNLIEKVSDQADLQFGSHPFRPSIYGGIVVDFIDLSGGNNCLKVIFLHASSVAANGAPTFDTSVPGSLTNYTSFPVYPLDVAANEVNAVYAIGDVIPVWRHSDVGVNADKINGTFVTMRTGGGGGAGIGQYQGQALFTVSQNQTGWSFPFFHDGI